MRKITVFIMLCILGTVMVIPVAAQDNLIRQWGAKAKASSQYGEDDYSMLQATGAPNVLGCNTSPKAWASLGITQEENLVILYSQPVFASQVNIYQSSSPGSITRVELLPETGAPIPVANSASPGIECPNVFSLDIEQMNTKVIGVSIWLDQTKINYWTEIDAVELVGVASLADFPVQIDRPTPETPGNKTEIPVQFDGPLGMTVTCDAGGTFNNGVEITVVQMRSGFNYRATAIGINGFDPILAVLGESGDGLCADDDPTAATYSASLPTTGIISPSGTSSQVVFANTSNSTFSDISLVVGGFEDAAGEFLLILEGMTFSTADGGGDPFSMNITPGMVLSGVDPTAYVISVTNAYDPFVSLIDTDYNVITDDDGFLVACDDAGNFDLCWGESASLSGSYVSRSQGRQLPGGPLDAMLKIPVSADMANGYLNYIVNGSQNTYGDYLMVFHVGIGNP